MKWRFSAGLMLSSFCWTPAFTQQITEVNQDVVGSKIFITYNIKEAGENQVFDVALYSSQDSFAKALRSVSGNGIGDNVSAGEDRTIIWDVLKDVKAFTGEYNFEVRALVHARVATTEATSASRGVVIRNKDEAFPVISNTLANFINEAKDLKDAFQFSALQALESRQALKSLSDAVDQYNLAYEKLNKERLSYEKLVENYWKRDVLTLEFKNLLDYALGDVHSVDILTLSQRLQIMNDLYGGRIKGSKKINETKKELTRDITQDVIRLDKRLQELEKRSNRVLYSMGQD
jgi:hypothetical protein